MFNYFVYIIIINRNVLFNAILTRMNKYIFNNCSIWHIVITIVFLSYSYFMIMEQHSQASDHTIMIF